MTPEQFTYWLQGFVELNGAVPNETQWLQIKDHLKLVFEKRTPTYPAYRPPIGIGQDFKQSVVTC
ncbi:TPA: hypothetical protein L5Y18_001728 [Pseudomonas aeruginosa]|uniref:hypothetical protein n=1 Tax=Pseudomonas aeruginosa TaxID=287 RepID=UPI00159CCAA4|nr:hypothetical protein [Pseudomonas aeruginosa]QKZ90954.1 hypothetical protein HWN48_22605 [Pseudomonas aeruginosa]HBP2068952.1 hypothetical protein [Pseudomonas aeruginosa]HBP2106815.1 hypothetical protein [Pseudomonas aeruginosa]HBP2501767.1 hypothetical protein [Pseudomonas aeruginosa]HBP2515643.1 hypothetical protein [Pseudomonas aeruginosa]